MAITINGTANTVAGLAVGGLPDGTTDADALASNAVTNVKVADDAIGVAELSATGTASSSTFLRGDNSWAAAGGGKILQVVQTIKNDVFTTNSTVGGNNYVDITGLAVTLTPASTSSKILVTTQIYNGIASGNVCFFRLLRGSTFINQPAVTSASDYYDAHAFSYYNALYQDSTSWSILDSPSTTSSTTYKIQMAVTGNTAAINAYAGSTSNYMGISMITAMEVGA